MHRDALSVDGMRLRCMLGTERPETMAAQDVIVSFTVYADLSGATRSDTLAETIDLGRLATSVRRYVSCASHELMESLAFEIARVLLTDFALQEVTVTVRKPGAFRDADGQSATLTRQRGDFK